MFGLPIDIAVEFFIYDMSGRVVWSVSSEYEAGVHELMLENMFPGIFIG